MKVLSLFDGISCGQQALKELGIPVEKYYASEIEKYPIAITQHNFPNTIQLGDVTKWREWDIDWSSIDLLQGGSPCQGFSFAGKQLNFEDPRSKLFFVFVDILNHIKQHNPNVKFLLENVRMKKEYQEVISEKMGVQPVMINSALVSAQNRVRLYWTNIGTIEQPEDRGILLKDVLEPFTNIEVVEKYPGDFVERSMDTGAERQIIGGAIRGRYKEDGKTEQKLELNGKEKANSLTTVQKDSLCIQQLPRGKNKGGQHVEKSPTLTSNSFEHNNHVTRCIQVGEANLKGHDSIKRVYSSEGKSPTLTTMGGGHREPKVEVRPIPNQVPEATKKGYVEPKDGDGLDLTFPNSKTRRGRLMEKKSNCLTAANYDYGVVRDKSKCVRSSGLGSFDRHEWDSVGNKDTELYWRKLTPIECERLQTLPDGFTEHMLVKTKDGHIIHGITSNTQRYRALGNGWTVEVIKHIYKRLNP